MNRTDSNRAETRILAISAVLLFGLLLLLEPAGGRFTLTLAIIGVVIYAVATYHALWALAHDLPRVFGGPPAAPPPAGEVPPAERKSRLAFLQSRVAVLVYALLVTLIAIAAVLRGELTAPALEQSWPMVALNLVQVSLALVLLALVLQAWLSAQRQAAPAPAPGPAGEEAPPPPDDVLSRMWAWITMFFGGLLRIVEAFVMILVKTVTVLLPSVARFGNADRKYLDSQKDNLIKTAQELKLSEQQQTIIKDRWIEQTIWAGGRANTERDANEIFRWWQIVLGASIPVFSLLGEPGNNVGRVLASIAGAFVAIITSVQQFRRPEERWRHYRILAENYLSEFWSYVSLTGQDYQDARKEAEDALEKARSAGDTEMNLHRLMFDLFDRNMTRLQKEELSTFFNQTMPAQQVQQVQQPTPPPAA